jgi:thiol:disulfide interchange protein
MKKHTFLLPMAASLLFALFGVNTPCKAQSEWFRGSWTQAKEEAAQEDKLILVDCYASWFRPCKWMDANVFNHPAVGDFYNYNFICLKVDMEWGRHASFFRAYGGMAVS